MEPKELLTKRKIEKLATEYGFRSDMIEDEQLGNKKFEVFVSHSSYDVEFIRKVVFFLKKDKGVKRGEQFKTVGGKWSTPPIEIEVKLKV